MTCIEPRSPRTSKYNLNLETACNQNLEKRTLLSYRGLYTKSIETMTNFEIFMKTKLTDADPKAAQQKSFRRPGRTYSIYHYHIK